MTNRFIPLLCTLALITGSSYQSASHMVGRPQKVIVLGGTVIGTQDLSTNTFTISPPTQNQTGSLQPLDYYVQSGTENQSENNNNNNTMNGNTNNATSGGASEGQNQTESQNQTEAQNQTQTQNQTANATETQNQTTNATEMQNQTSNATEMQNQTQNATEMQNQTQNASQSQNETVANETQLTSNETQPSENASAGQEYLGNIAALAESLNGMASPTGAADNLTVALENLLENSNGLEEVAALINQGPNDQLVEYFDVISINDDRTFPEVDRTLSLLFSNQGKDECYQQFSTAIGEIYVAWSKFQTQITNQSNLSSPEQALNFQDFCNTEEDYVQTVQNLGNLILGVGECDVLQTLYEGSLNDSIWVGWRDNIVDKASYLILYLAKGIITIQACGLEENMDAYDQMFQDAISRVFQFNMLAKLTLQQTVAQNAQQLMKIYEGLSLEALALNVNYYTLSLIYPDYLWQMAVVYSNSSSMGQDFYVECWNCVNVLQGDYHANIAWLSKNSTASLSPDALDNISKQNQSTNESSNNESINGNQTSNESSNGNQTSNETSSSNETTGLGGSSNQDVYCDYNSSEGIQILFFNITNIIINQNAANQSQEQNMTGNENMNNNESSSSNMTKNESSSSNVTNNESSPSNATNNTSNQSQSANETSSNNQTNATEGGEENLQQESTQQSPGELATQLWDSLGNCTSGIIIFNNQLPYYVNTQFEDRVVFNIGNGTHDVYAWGIQEFCYGRPPSSLV